MGASNTSAPFGVGWQTKLSAGRGARGHARATKAAGLADPGNQPKCQSQQLRNVSSRVYGSTTRYVLDPTSHTQCATRHFQKRASAAREGGNRNPPQRIRDRFTWRVPLAEEYPAQ